MSPRNYVQWTALSPAEVSFAIGADRQGKTVITMVLQPTCCDVAFVSPACVTNWPRCTGDGNFGTMWGPSDIHKAKFSLDLTDSYINGVTNPYFTDFANMLEMIDEKLLDFVHGNQLKILGRKNLSREEVKMLQIRTVRARYDKHSGQLTGHSVQTTTSKFAWDGMGGKFERRINVCDRGGSVIPGGNVLPGDVVAATVFANQVYTGVGGDKFGIHWSFEDISVICQRAKLDSKTSVPAFGETAYDFAQDYEHPTSAESAAQFSD